MRLVPCDFPASTKVPQYAKWEPVMAEFIELNVTCALMEGVNAETKTLGQLRSCAKMRFDGKVSVHTKEGKVYLTREVK